MSCRGLSPASSHPRASEPAAPWIPATSAGMTAPLPLQRNAPHLFWRGEARDALAQAVECHRAHACPRGRLLDLPEHDVGSHQPADLVVDLEHLDDAHAAEEARAAAAVAAARLP